MILEYNRKIYNTSSLDAGEGGLNKLYLDYQRNARSSEREFNLTKEQFKILTSNDCFYCGKPPSCISSKFDWGRYLYNGIDRKDNNLGYVLENCVPCCADCNDSKHIHSVQEYQDYIKHIKFINNYSI